MALILLDNEDPAPEHTAALSRLVLLGFAGAASTDPHDLTLTYVRPCTTVAGLDVVHVMGYDAAHAVRMHASGTPLAYVRGTPAEVVAEVLSW